MRSLEPLLTSREIARLLGIKTRTLARWRAQGRGPVGWIRLSPTLLALPVSALNAYIEDAKRMTAEAAVGSQA
jgi:hypothetical protein